MPFYSREYFKYSTVLYIPILETFISGYSRCDICTPRETQKKSRAYLSRDEKFRATRYVFPEIDHTPITWARSTEFSAEVNGTHTFDGHENKVNHWVFIYIDISRRWNSGSRQYISVVEEMQWLINRNDLEIILLTASISPSMWR